MRDWRRQFGWGIGELRAFLRWPSLLLIFCLTAHSLDACEAHIALPKSASQATSRLACKATQPTHTPCELCSFPSNHSPNLCEVTSEVSTTASHGFQLDAPVVVAVSPFAPPQDFFVLAPPSGTTRSRDGPDVPSLVSLHLRSTLPGRSPPLSA